MFCPINHQKQEQERKNQEIELEWEIPFQVGKIAILWPETHSTFQFSHYVILIVTLQNFKSFQMDFFCKIQHTW